MQNITQTLHLKSNRELQQHKNHSVHFFVPSKRKIEQTQEKRESAHPIFKTRKYMDY